jgi:hypothetical protein
MSAWNLLFQKNDKKHKRPLIWMSVKFENWHKSIGLSNASLWSFARKCRSLKMTNLLNFLKMGQKYTKGFYTIFTDSKNFKRSNFILAVVASFWDTWCDFENEINGYYFILNCMLEIVKSILLRFACEAFFYT